MFIIPAIDLYSGKAVRLLRGDYDNMTVYSDNPAEIAADFEKNGSGHIHIVDLEGAKSGTTPNLDTVREIVKTTGLFTEIGGGIRSLDTVEKYLSAGVDRVILGTAAVTDESMLLSAVKEYKNKIAVGVDIKDGFVAIKGWTEKSSFSAPDFCAKMQDIGVDNIICTDISKDGAMQGTNRGMYRELAEKFSMKITASGGVSDLEDVRALKEMNIYGCIIGKAYYTGKIKINEAIEVAACLQKE